MQNSEFMNGSPVCPNTTTYREPRAATIVSTAENIIARTAACAPANDDLLHGRTVPRCASCRDCAHGISRQTIEWRGGVGVWATSTCCARGVPGPDMDPATCEGYTRGRC